jgi:hypothetical protein
MSYEVQLEALIDEGCFWEKQSHMFQIMAKDVAELCCALDQVPLYGTVLPSYHESAAKIQRVCETASEHTASVGKALNHVAASYADLDKKARENFRKLPGG